MSKPAYYKVYIPTIHLKVIETEILSKIKDGYTLISAIGNWKGETENITIFEYIRFSWNNTTDNISSNKLIISIINKLFELKEQAVLVFSGNEPLLFTGGKV